MQNKKLDLFRLIVSLEQLDSFEICKTPIFKESMAFRQVLWGKLQVMMNILIARAKDLAPCCPPLEADQPCFASNGFFWTHEASVTALQEP